ncbi:WD40 repeat domain-containing protein [Nitratiruptor sp. YY09-18]|uniref:WD40 repeat domain-containing protein n=1 Tax=Nitratiruptor sp. YY09-18 TaxID=2724901 RepID=UPI001915DB1B|nr:hypothetical protein [Nitratiruptor sp. YY09-18]BCD68881.1 periplasmic nitrate reductase component NapL [Nitratiruptor sp. YY09-18]
MKIFIVLLLGVLLYGADLSPASSVNIKAAVLDAVFANHKIYLATDAGKVVIMDENLSVQKSLRVRKIKDFMGTLHDADIYSVDVLDDQILYLAQAEDGYAELYLYRDGNASKVLDKSLHLYAKAAKFVDKQHAILALMSDEVVLYDLVARKIVKRAKAGEYFYAAMAMDPSRKMVAIGDEGGEVVVLNPQNLEHIKLFKDVNKDKILSIAINNPLIAAGSRADKTLAIYNLRGGKPKVYKNPDFFIYVTTLSPMNHYVVFGDNEKYILKVASVESLDIQYRLIGHKNIVNVVRFLDEKRVLSASETGEIKIWRLP